MSLPATTADISANPTKMGVTAPVNSANKDADVARKLKLLGVVQGFRDGRMPDNKQIQEALTYAGTHSPVELNKLSPEGRVLIDDTRDILETLSAIVHEKNADELFQNAVWHTSGGDITRGKQDKDSVIPVSKSDADAEAKQAIAHLRTLVTLFITNSEARKLFSDVGLIGRDLFATGAAKAAEKARPDQEQLDQVDKPAPSGEWIGPDGKKVGKNETPELQLKGPQGSEVRYNPKDDPREAQVTDHEGQQRSAGHVYDKAQEAKNEAQQQKEQAKSEARDNKEDAKSEAKSHAKDVAGARDPNASLTEQKDQMMSRANDKAPEGGREDAEQTKQSLKDRMFGLKDKIPEEHRERANQQVERTKNFLNDNIPEERRDQFIYRLKKVVVECQEHSDYNEAMSWFLDTFENYKGHAKHVTGAGADSAKSVADDPAYKQATLEVRTLFERFANGQSMQPIIDALDDLYTDAQNDEGLRNWFTKFNQYLHAVLLEPGYILEDASTKEGKELRDSGREYFEGKYKPHFQHFFDEVAQWFTAMAEDPLNVRLGDDIKRLTKDLLFDENGSLTFKPALWEDLRRYILPSLIEQIGYVPIPRSEYSDDQIDLVVENLVLSGPNLFPNIVNIDAHNHFSFSPYENINKKLNTHHHTIHIGLSQIQADLRDVAFSFRRKKGWPKISDHGLADVVIGGKGISADITLESVENSRSYVFKVKESKVTVDTLKFSIRDSRHDLLYKFVKATANNVIKKAIQTAVGVAIKNALEELNSQLVEVRNRMEDAKKSDDTNRVDALKQVFQKKKEEAEHKKAEHEPKGTFRIVTNRDSQLNPDMSHNHKASFTQKQFKVEDAAQSGKDWRSPVFSLVDSKHPAVTGEHHPATSTAQKAAAGAADAAHTGTHARA